ncbi:hypothetical protein GE118_04240 [Mycoplasma sp. NEAQ87857]|uniref:MAGa4850 family ICE element protein n=1 Tax=Mycoplasma sp. NEAQ87857 TaxID=2683967 RepID=UPI001316A732|nr:hypothetical protein [Mycoplasma sp. NEAQ87857]QGZ97986.1 hypothetical protein GE118_04240 [Mycoplasma sp. NEAQ87857]
MGKYKELLVLQQEFIFDDKKIKEDKRDANFIKLYNSKKYNKLPLQIVNKICKTKFYLPKKVLDVIKDKQSVCEFLAVANLFKARKKFVSFNKIAKYFPKTTFYRALKFCINNKLIVSHDKKFKLNFGDDKRCFVALTKSYDWKLFFLYGMNVLITKKKEQYAIKNANNKKQVLLQNKYLGLKKSTAYNHLKKICNFELVDYRRKYLVKKIYHKIDLSNKSDSILLFNPFLLDPQSLFADTKIKKFRYYKHQHFFKLTSERYLVH